MWETLRPDEQANGECASAGCGARPFARFEYGGVSSDYCADCTDKIERMRIKSIETNREIDELECRFGAIE